MAYDAHQVMEVLGAAAEENQLCSLRQQQVVLLPDEGEFWITGDLHDHRRNFEKLIRHADLAAHPQRHLLLHELIHGDHFDAQGADASWQMLYRAAELKCDFPQQVHFVLGNHDLAQVHGEGILKGGQSVCEAFTRGVRHEFGAQADRVVVAITEFLMSLPLAVRTQSGLFCCHSLPTDAHAAHFDHGVFDRALTGPDYARRTGAVYQLIWGRHTSAETASAFAAKVGARILITGHQPQEQGYRVNGPQHLILASEHSRGVFLPVDLGTEYDMSELVKQLRWFVAIE